MLVLNPFSKIKGFKVFLIGDGPKSVVSKIEFYNKRYTFSLPANICYSRTVLHYTVVLLYF